MTREVNFDGLVGPTHNYAGLSFGNIAAMKNSGQRSNPKAAALQGLTKMRHVLKLGIPQGILPPHERPFLPAMRNLGFTGSDRQVLQSAWAANKQIVTNLSSASAMWTANAATVSPRHNCIDGKVHFTPANLVSMPHRSFEPITTTRILRKIFPDPCLFMVHDPLPANTLFSDEGAANHNRISANHGTKGIELFVHGRTGTLQDQNKTRFPERQTLEACQATAQRHNLANERALFAAQGKSAIDAGAFHNDVVCVTNETAILFHEQAFENLNGTREQIKRTCGALAFEPQFIMASKEAMPLEDAIKSYFFNSQLLTLPDGTMELILPSNVEETPTALAFAQNCLEGDNPIKAIHFFNLKESMQNGGGPACLRLRVPLTETEYQAVHSPVLMTEEKLDILEAWVTSHYRDRLDPDDLGDPDFLIETQTALDALAHILELGSFYDFQCDTMLQHSKVDSI